MAVNRIIFLSQSKPISSKTVVLQEQAVATWKSSCSKLGNISKPTLVIVVTEDAVTPAVNSMILTQKFQEHGWYRLMEGDMD